MLSPTLGQVSLYAVVPPQEAPTRRTALRGLRLVECGPMVAVIGKPAAAVRQAALRHDRAVGRALEAFTSTVPFRLGIELEPEVELPRVLATNQQVLTRYLARFQGRVEMALKVKLDAQPGGEPPRVPSGLERFHALTPESRDRKERVKRTATASIFEGCYLISRRDIEAFWSAVEDLRLAAPRLPMMGSGPWAPYNFCDFALRPAPRGAGAVHDS